MRHSIHSAALHAQPALLASVAAHPNGIVRVIVQEAGSSPVVESTVRHLGGHVRTNLPMIHAFAATLPARALPQLASARDVRWLSPDGPVTSTGNVSSCTSSACINTSNLKSAYDGAVGAPQVWNSYPYLQGQGIGVAVVDSGISSGSSDFAGPNGSRVVAQGKFNSSTTSMSDGYGHGTVVAGIIGGNGALSTGGYIGIAPKVNLINVKVSDDNGAASESDVVNGLQWVLSNAGADNIRVVNLSLNTTTLESYNVDPLDAACEVLWTNGIVVVVSAGNNGSSGATSAIYPPANDPFVITVGSVNDHGTVATKDDTLAGFSAYGTTTDGFAKPDLVAPGVNIVGTMAGLGTVLAKNHPANVVNQSYFRMSGSSTSAPIVSGAVALLLQSNPKLTPDQVKYRLTSTAQKLATTTGVGGGEVSVNDAVGAKTTQSANTKLPLSKLIVPGASGSTWTSVSWGSISWGSVSWGSATFGSVSWGSDYWGA